MQYTEWSCKENPAQMSQELGNSMSKIPQGFGKPSGRFPIQRQESSGMELGGPSQLQVIQTEGYSSSRSVCKEAGTQGSPILQPESLR